MRVTQNINGVKGVCCLSYLKFYHPVSSTCIDYMHSVLEGVLKSLFSLWFEKDNDLKYSLKSHINKIDARLVAIRPPKFVPTAPRSIKYLKTWRAHEYLSFLLYYSLPLFSDIMEREQFDHLKKLCLFMQILLSKEIKKDDLGFAQTIIVDFVEKFKDFYGERNMMSGVHELLHLFDCTQDFGPLNLMNCFQFEELNRKVVGFIHGRDLMGEEFIKIFNLIQGLMSNFSLISPQSVFYDFIKNEIKFKTSNKKNSNTNDRSVKKSNRIKELTDENLRKTVKMKLNLTDADIDRIEYYNKFFYNGIIYTSSSIVTNFCDSSFITNNNKIGIIKHIFSYNSVDYFLSEKVLCLCNPFLCSASSERKVLMSICKLTGQFFIEELKDIKKTALIQVEDKVFVSTFTVSHLFNWIFLFLVCFLIKIKFTS